MKHFMKKIINMVCLLMTVGILCIIPQFSVQASSTSTGLTGETTESTTKQDPGTAEDQSDLSQLNIGNTFTITSNEGNGQINGTLRILITLTLIALAPTLLIMLTSFTQTAPPNQVLIGLALFLTFFVMRPTITTIYTEALVPFENGEITQEEFFDEGLQPLREFMYGQTQKKDVTLFFEISGEEWDGTLDGIPTEILIPSFIISELRTAFIIGFYIYIPFIVIDMVVASVLMGMGMMMLPPTTISMPFKILLFILADGWSLIIGNLIKTFY